MPQVHLRHLRERNPRMRGSEMKKLLKYMKGYGRECFLGPLLKLLEAALELLVPYVIFDIINTGIVNDDRGYIVGKMFILIGMGLAGLLFSVAAQYFSAKAAVGFSSKVREVLFAYIMRLGYPEIDKTGKSTFITRLTSDINQVQTGINLTLRLFLRSPFIVFGAMICAFTIDKSSAMVFVGVIPVLALVVFSIMLSTIPLYRKVQQKLDVILSKTRENLSGVRMLRALCKEDEEISEFGEKNNELNHAQKFVGKISALMNPLTYVIINAAIVVLIYTGALRVNEGILTQAAIIALYNYMSQILVELIKLANLIITITKAVACGNRVAAVLETEPSMTVQPETFGDDRHTVEFRDVSFRYSSGGENALSDIDFTADPGQTIGIIGGTGSGKTTLVNLICRFYDATGGEVLVDGKNVKSYDFPTLRNKVGIVPQGSSLFRGDVRSNIKFGNENAGDDEIWAALEAAQAKGFVSEKPGQLDFEIEQGGKNLSGGQRQRLTVARALVRRPEILILDDSSSALDYATDLALRHAIKNLDYKPVIFIVSQRASTLRGSDKIIVLDEGKAVGMGTHDGLYDSCPVYREICDSQTKNR